MRNHWGSRLGFILAAAGSAVGLGNIWKFPFITGVNGGGAFVLVYLIAIMFCGLPILMAEFAIGRAGQKDVVGSFKELAGGHPFFKHIGWIFLAAAFVILSYYNVVAGWALNYLVKSVLGAFSGLEPAAIGGLFDNLVSSASDQIIYHAFFSALGVAVVLGGIKNGIERWSKVLMPTLFAILLFMFVYGMTTDGAGAAISFMFRPDFSKLTVSAVLEAIGHSFFTLSLAMGAMVTYASYLDDKEKIVPVSVRIAALDTLVAIIAGLALFPIVFSVGLEPAAGPGLIFKTLPQVFSGIFMGNILAVLFFLLLSFAALTSAISLLEVLTAWLIDEKNMSRAQATLLMGVLVYIAGIPSALSFNALSDTTIFGMALFDAIDYFASNYLLPLGGMLTAVFAGYIMDKRLIAAQIAEDAAVRKVFTAWYAVIRYVAPVAVLLVFLVKVGIL